MILEDLLCTVLEANRQIKNKTEREREHWVYPVWSSSVSHRAQHNNFLLILFSSSFFLETLPTTGWKQTVAMLQMCLYLHKHTYIHNDANVIVVALIS